MIYCKSIFAKPQLHQAERGVGRIVHGLHLRASAGTRSAMPAQSDIPPALLIHIVAKGSIAGLQIS